MDVELDPQLLRIELEPGERRLFDFLLEVVEWHFRNPSSSSSSSSSGGDARIQVRVAGGWVRDKLLKRSSNDIDLVVDKVRGVDFANLVIKFDAKRQKRSKANDSKKTTSSSSSSSS